MFKNEEEYNKAIDLLEEIGDREDFETTPKLIEQFNSLSALIEAYESDNANLNIGNPIEIIKLKMSYLGLKQKDLIGHVGSSGVVSEVLNKKRALSKAMIRNLSDFLHLDQDLLNVEYDLVESPKKSISKVRAKVNSTFARFPYLGSADVTAFKSHVSQRGALFSVGC